MAEALTVTQYNQLITTMVKNSPGVRDVIIVGEISGFRRQQIGHCYFDLKDQNETVRCTMFRYAASRLRFVPKDGMKVNVFGSASYYCKGGTLNFNVESMAESGKGDLKAALEALTAKLLAEGLFEPERKRKLPKYPHTIGVVTSATGSVIKDIIDTTARRFPVNILLAPAKVQGEGAPQSIIQGLELLNRMGVDVIIVCRGGGSIDDLSAFNDEAVARAVAASKIPTISAVGHATDKSLTDRVADVCAETPTAAAMLATPNAEDEATNLYNLVRRVKASLTSINYKNWSKFNILEGKLSPKIFTKRAEASRLKLEGFSDRLSGFVKQIVNKHNQDQMTLGILSENMDKGILGSIGDWEHRLELQSKLLSGLDPKSVLGRGYSFVTDSEGRVLTSVTSVREGSDISVAMRDGTVEAKVKGVRKK